MATLSSLLIFAGMILFVRRLWLIAKRSTHGADRQGRKHWNSRYYRQNSTEYQARPYQSDHDLLQVPRTATKVEVTAAYRRLVKQYHPDTVAHLAPEFRELAEHRMKEINAAYQNLTRS